MIRSAKIPELCISNREGNWANVASDKNFFTVCMQTALKSDLVLEKY